MTMTARAIIERLDIVSHVGQCKLLVLVDLLLDRCFPFSTKIAGIHPRARSEPARKLSRQLRSHGSAIVESTAPVGSGVVAQIKCEVERDPDETGGMKSRVHPKYKTKYRVRNWASYERALIGRGNITIWLSRAAIAAWKPEGTRTRGAPPKYSDLAIETVLTLRLLFHLPLRQAEGFLTSLFHLMGLDLRSPDHTTLSRRGQHLNPHTPTRSQARRPAPLHRQHWPVDGRRG